MLLYLCIFTIFSSFCSFDLIISNNITHQNIATSASNTVSMAHSNTKSTPTARTWTQKLNASYENIESIIKQSDSFLLRLFLAILLGLLLSLTPCIYPMIPVTVGILQAQRQHTVGYNFLLALSYTLGLSTTFATLGLLVSYSGPLYGKFLSHPLFVCILASVLIYLALTMLDIIPLYIPRFMKNNKATSTHGSLLSAFAFGAASGTFASPCVSPGLILLLSVVATMNNTLAGFALLFAFGFGLSLPLLLIGTFSTSLNMLPQAGMWMVEVKKLFGVLLLFTALYYLSNSINFCVILALLTITLFLLSIFYWRSTSNAISKKFKWFYIIISFIFMCTSLFSAVQTFILSYCYVYAPQQKKSLYWQQLSFQEALLKAKKENKLLFVDVWADYCSMCKLIDKTLLSNRTVTDNLPALTVPLKIHEDDKNFQAIKEHYSIVGLPTFLLINPHNKSVIKQWGSDLYYVDPTAFIKHLEDLRANSILTKTID